MLINFGEIFIQEIEEYFDQLIVNAQIIGIKLKHPNKSAIPTDDPNIGHYCDEPNLSVKTETLPRRLRVAHDEIGACCQIFQISN